MTHDDTPHSSQLLSVTSVAEILDVSRGHVYSLVNANELRTVDVGVGETRGKTRIYLADLEDFIARRTRRVKRP